MTIEASRLQRAPSQLRETTTAKSCKRWKSMLTRCDAWNVIKEQNWVQQTVADRDKIWGISFGKGKKCGSVKEKEKNQTIAEN